MNPIVIDRSPATTLRTSALVAELAERFGSRMSVAQAVRDQHGRDESPYDAAPPEVVVYAQNIDDVVEVVTACNRFRVPLIPYGAGSSVEGHLLAVRGGVSLDLSQMNRILRVDADDLMATVEPGVTRHQLNASIKDSGLFFPIDPGADASIGGMAATRASGTNAVRYGTMRENVLSMVVVTPAGDVIRTAAGARKSSAGYDLTRLFVGSEGTLGVIVSVTVRLYPLPEALSAAVCSFPDVTSAVHTVMQSIQIGVPIARAELLDALTMKAINRHSGTTMAEQPTLFLEFHGSPQAVEEQARTVQALATDNLGRDFEWATRPEDRSRLWNARHTAYFACLQLKAGSRAFTTDACVPISRLAQCIEETIADLELSSLPSPIFGHVGDGNFHCLILADPGSPAEMEEAESLHRRVMQRALAMEGTCTGEHGVGLHKIALLRDEMGEAGVELMRRIKGAIDPHWIMNPVKVVGEPPAAD